MEILRAENLTKIYGTGENQVVALDHVSFSVNKGEFLATIRFRQIHTASHFRRCRYTNLRQSLYGGH
jgi:hypothetical protein